MVISAISREGSTVYDLARMAADLCERAGAEVDFVTPADTGLPLNDGTVAWDLPEVTAWRDRVAAASMHIWVSPEYHGAITASLKNLFDYLDKAAMQGDVVGLCALAGGSVTAVNTLNGMTVIARSLGAWVVPSMCALGSDEVREGLSEGAQRRLKSMCDQIMEMSSRLHNGAAVAEDVVVEETAFVPEVVPEIVVEETTPDPEPPPPQRRPLTSHAPPLTIVEAVPAAMESEVERPPAPALAPVRGVSLDRETTHDIAGTRWIGRRTDDEVFVRMTSAPLGSASSTFEREQRDVMALAFHPNLAVVLDSGVEPDGRGVVITHAAHGRHLVEHLKNSGPLPWPEVLDAGVRLASALATVHESGMVHRAVEPTNILVLPNGQMQVTDVAVALDHLVGLEQLTPAALAHLAPERFRGEPATRATDLYGLGSTLFTMLVGRPAFSDETDRKIAMLIRRISLVPVPDLRYLVEEAVGNVISRAMAKRPEDRYESAEEMVRALQQAQLQTEAKISTGYFAHVGSRNPESSG